MTQQIIAYESGVVNSIDPLGGTVKAIEQGFVQKEIADSAYKFQRELEKKERIMIGVNEIVDKEERRVSLYRVGESVETRQRERLRRLMVERDSLKVRESLQPLRKACRSDENLMPYVLDCVSNYATLQGALWGKRRAQDFSI